MKILRLLPFLFIACVTEEVQEPEQEPVVLRESWLLAVEEDPIYRQLVKKGSSVNISDRITTDYKRWVEVFIQDAERVAGLDLSYVLDGELILRPSGELPLNTDGWAWGRCDDNRVEIGLQSYLLTGRMPRGAVYNTRDKANFSNTIQTFYHEFGHDILNLLHTCNQYDIMFNNTSEDYPCFGELVEIPDDDPLHPVWDYQAFIEARDRMFNNVNQYYQDCD